MKITGTRSTITFDLENGFLLKAQGELLINKKFVVILVTFGLAFNLGSSMFSQIFPGRSSLPTTALISPDTCAAYTFEASSQAVTLEGVLKSHSGITIFVSSIVDLM